MINERIRDLRKKNNLTQEELADKLNVSRQAITKWESGLGTPDISNIEAIAKLFNITVDELLSGNSIKMNNISKTEFDIFKFSDIDLKIGNANTLDISLIDSEKVIVELESDLELDVYKFAKVKIENENSVEISVLLNKSKDINISKQDCKNHLFVKVLLPKNLVDDIELDANIKKLNIHDFDIEKHIEFDGRVEDVNILNVNGHFELNSNMDMEINYDGSLNQLDINQLNSISNLYIKKDIKVNVYSKGRASKVLFNDYDNDNESSSKVELNGFRSELTVNGI
ncbi:MAG: helix-turn-helix domain-containing protein [Acholeplasmatales bacterium]|nr:helix-turn-helix domain-containing protein [Acholeplasmatales bacterium]